MEKTAREKCFFIKHIILANEVTQSHTKKPRQNQEGWHETIKWLFEAGETFLLAMRENSQREAVLVAVAAQGLAALGGRHVPLAAQRLVEVDGRAEA